MTNHQINFKDRVVIITGAGGGLGKEYAKMFAKRGAKVVVNDLGSSSAGGGSSSKNADRVVDEIKGFGGIALPNYDSVLDGEKIVEQTVKAFGRVDILINNAGILRDKTVKNISDEDWEIIHMVHLRGAYKMTKACWEYFKKQNYGRIIMTASGAGLYGNYGQCNYSSAKLALVSFSNTLSKEGAKYNIYCNAIAPIAASRLTESILPKEVFQVLKPEFIAPLVGYLCSENSSENGGIFECGAGQYYRLRWQRSKGSLFKADKQTFLPGSILQNWRQVVDFNECEYPQSIGDTDWVSLAEEANKLSSNPRGKDLRFENKVAIVTGAGGGLGKQYALLLARLGAKVVVNDLKINGKSNADQVVNEIKSNGGTAISNYDSVEEGEKIVQHCLKTFGRVDIVINNAGILRDKSFVKMTDRDWDQVYNVHLKGTYKVTKAAWPIMLKQNYGRIINTSSAVGLYGNFGQANYSACKGGILGFSMTCAVEGAKSNIKVNCVVPNAGTAMTATIMPKEIVEMLKPEFVAPMTALLAHEECPESGCAYEVGSCFIAKVRWQRTSGVGFDIGKEITPEMIENKIDQISDFDNGKVTYPKSLQQSLMIMIEGVETMKNNRRNNTSNTSSNNSSVSDVVTKAKNYKFDATTINYTFKDVILYALSLGAKRNELDYIYESSEGFKVIPTYLLTATISDLLESPLDEVVPNFNPMKLLHGEQFLEIKKHPIPTEATLKSSVNIIDMIDKRKMAVLIMGQKIKDEEGNVIAEAEATVVIRGSGGFGGGGAKSQSSRNKDAIATNDAPKRRPDKTIEVRTNNEQAALHRLCGDLNPLHIDPEFAKGGGFEVPISHGLCTYGVATKSIIDHYANGDVAQFKSVKARFASPITPGDVIQIFTWVDDNDSCKVIFEVYAPKTKHYAIKNAAIKFHKAVKQNLNSNL